MLNNENPNYVILLICKSVRCKICLNYLPKRICGQNDRLTWHTWHSHARTGAGATAHWAALAAHRPLPTTTHHLPATGFRTLDYWQTHSPSISRHQFWFGNYVSIRLLAPGIWYLSISSSTLSNYFQL